MTTLSDGGDQLTTWNQRGGGGRVQASRFWSLRRRFHLRLAPSKAECAAPDRKGPMASGHTCFVPSRAKTLSVTSAYEILVASTNLKRDTGNTEDSLCNWIQLEAVNVLFVSAWMWRTTSAKTANRLVHGLLYRPAHQWGVLL